MRLLALGSLQALSAELGVSERTARGWAEGRFPRRWSEERALRFATELYATSHASDLKRSPGERRALAEALARPSYSHTALRKAAERLDRELRQRAREGRGSATELAAELGVASGKLRGWLRRGSVPERYMRDFDGWAQSRADEQFQERVEKERARELIEQAKQPGLAPRLTGETGPRRRAKTAPNLKNDEGPAESDAHAGYVWQLRVEAWLTPKGLARLEAWARSRRRDMRNLRPAPRWCVTALGSVFLTGGSGGGPTKRRYPGSTRHFGRVSDREFARRLELGNVWSSGTVKRAGLEVAVRRFHDDIAPQLASGDRIFIHGVIVRNWRVRTGREKADYRQRWRARREIEQAALRRKQERRKEQARESVRAGTRAKVSGRRSPGKTPGRSRGGR